ncbi:MAG: hypothetical protein C5B59_05835 [Bacteroidetes bacterium]|nr:MAG: hypothetical protein C5B59_05835 [Bacteroidota bacterium]
MFRTLGIEWMKIKNYRTFWILLAITIICIPAFNYTVYDLMDNSFPKIRGKSIFGSPFAFPDVWLTVSWNSSLLFIIPAILIITLTTNEFSYRTHRQNIIDGWSRIQFISIKLVEVFILSILMTLIVFLTTLYFGGIANKLPQGVGLLSNTQYLFYFFVQMISYSTIAFLIAVFIRRAGLSMGIFFVYMVLEQFVVSYLRNKYKMNWVDYLPEEVTDRLLPQPYTQKVLNSPAAIETWHHHIPIYLGIAAVYLTVYCSITIWRFTKADL